MTTSTRAMSTYVPDWMRCIICYQPGRNGAITHLRTCADYVRTDRPGARSVALGDLLGRRR